MIEGTGERLTEWATRARQAIPALDLLWEFFQRFRKRNGTVLVGHMSYRLFLWLAPLMLVFVAGLGLSSSAFDIISYAEDVGVPEETAEDAVAQAEHSGTTALVLGLSALVVASWSLVRGMHYAYSQVWDIPIRSRKNVVRQSLYTILGAIAVGLVMAVISALQRQGPLFAFAGWASSFALATIGLWVVQWMMPRRTERWRDLLPGPVFGAIGLSVLHVFAAVYLPSRIESASALYGTFGVVFAVLFWVFLMAYLLILAPFLNSVWVDRAEILGGRPWVIDPEAVPRLFRGPLGRLIRRDAEADGPEGPQPPGD